MLATVNPKLSQGGNNLGGKTTPSRNEQREPLLVTNELVKFGKQLVEVQKLQENY